MIETHDEYLSEYTGNSEWWYPTEKTNIDKTKGLLQNIAQDVLDQNDVKNQSGTTYLNLPHNELMDYLDNQILEVNYKLQQYAHAAYWNPDNNLWWYIFAPLTILFFILTPIFAFRETH